MKGEPNWITKDIVVAIHGAMTARFGGISGIRDDGLLESELGRPRHLFAHCTSDLPELAGAYAFGIVKNHPFLDGNKRTGFMTAYTFLGLNGLCLVAPEPEAAVATLRLADGTIIEEGYARFLRDFSERVRK